MDKKKLTGYALMGLTSAMLIGCQNGQGGQKPGNGKQQAERSGIRGKQQSAMTPQQKAFYNKLNAQGKEDFNSMSNADRDKAIKESNNCSGKNSCEGMGGCSNSKHDCKGKNSCKGQGGCSKTPDESVELISQKRS